MHGPNVDFILSGIRSSFSPCIHPSTHRLYSPEHFFEGIQFVRLPRGRSALAGYTFLIQYLPKALIKPWG